jgi:hypothetical protein
MIHETRKLKSNIVMMWCDPFGKGEQEIKFVAKDGVQVNDGDAISVGSNEHPCFYILHQIKESRPATVSGYNYITATAVRDIALKETA